MKIFSPQKIVRKFEKENGSRLKALIQERQSEENQLTFNKIDEEKMEKTIFVDTTPGGNGGTGGTGGTGGNGGNGGNGQDEEPPMKLNRPCEKQEQCEKIEKITKGGFVHYSDAVCSTPNVGTSKDLSQNRCCLKLGAKCKRQWSYHECCYGLECNNFECVLVCFLKQDSNFKTHYQRCKGSMECFYNYVCGICQYDDKKRCIMKNEDLSDLNQYDPKRNAPTGVFKEKKP